MKFGRVSREVEISGHQQFLETLGATHLGLVNYLASSLEFLLVPFVGWLWRSLNTPLKMALSIVHSFARKIITEKIIEHLSLVDRCHCFRTIRFPQRCYFTFCAMLFSNSNLNFLVRSQLIFNCTISSFVITTFISWSSPKFITSCTNSYTQSILLVQTHTPNQYFLYKLIHPINTSCTNSYTQSILLVQTHPINTSCTNPYTQSILLVQTRTPINTSCTNSYTQSILLVQTHTPNQYFLYKLVHPINTSCTNS